MTRLEAYLLERITVRQWLLLTLSLLLVGIAAFNGGYFWGRQIGRREGVAMLVDAGRQAIQQVSKDISNMPPLFGDGKEELARLKADNDRQDRANKAERDHQEHLKSILAVSSFKVGEELEHVRGHYHTEAFLLNKSDKSIDSFNGKILITDQFGAQIERLFVRSDERVAVGAAMTLKDTDEIGQRTIKLLAETPPRAHAVLQVDEIIYGDGLGRSSDG